MLHSKNFDGYILFEGQPTSKCVIEISTTVPSPSTGKKENKFGVDAKVGNFAIKES